jgi:hypothetical protein
MHPYGLAVHDGLRYMDHASLLGAWRNTDGGAGGVRRLSLIERDGALRLRVFGAGRAEPYDWGEVEAIGYSATPTSASAWAFTAVYDSGVRSMKISAYTKGGLLVLNTCNAFHGPGWPAPYWTREFFHREGNAPDPAEPYRGAAVRDLADRATAPLGPWQLDPTALVAMWRNVDPAANRLAWVRIAERAGYLAVHPHGVWAPRRHDWHETVASAYAEDVRTSAAVAFTAFFELAVGRVEMVGYLERRLLTIETATVFGDRSRRNPYYVREHFYPS